MARKTLGVVIRRPVKDVWDLLNDMERFSVAWGEHYTLTSGGPIRVGSTIAEDDGATATITQHNPQRDYSFVVKPAKKNPIVASVAMGFVLEPIDQGTRLTAWFEPTFTAFGRLLQPAIVPIWALMARKPANRVKRYLEQGLSGART